MSFCDVEAWAVCNFKSSSRVHIAAHRRNSLHDGSTSHLQAAAAISMIGFAYASVPLYKLFCAVSPAGHGSLSMVFEV